MCTAMKLITVLSRLQFLLPADNPRMSGFDLWDAADAYEDPKTGKEKTYKYKTFHPVSLVEP